MKEEKQYNEAIKNILTYGEEVETRSGPVIKGVFASTMMKFSLAQGTLPLLTSKKMQFASIVRELLWFISGSTRLSDLQKRGCHIWDANAAEWPDDDLGPIYGHQWRNFGGTTDQLKNVIKSIKEDPQSRRHIICSWNAAEVDKGVLPPCHVLCQFDVSHGNRLSCFLYQRSGDIGLGVPFNIASYSLLTILIAHCCDLEPGFFIYHIGNAHIYKNHVEGLVEQLQRPTHQFPTVVLAEATPKDIDKIEEKDIILEDYVSEGPIKLVMSV